MLDMIEQGAKKMNRLVDDLPTSTVGSRSYPA